MNKPFIMLLAGFLAFILLLVLIPAFAQQQGKNPTIPKPGTDTAVVYTKVCVGDLLKSLNAQKNEFIRQFQTNPDWIALNAQLKMYEQYDPKDSIRIKMPARAKR